jgi:hypothetical protein
LREKQVFTFAAFFLLAERRNRAIYGVPLAGKKSAAEGGLLFAHSQRRSSADAPCSGVGVARACPFQLGSPPHF